MDIRTFLFTTRTSSAQMSRDLGVSRNHMSQVVRGETRPSARFARDIAAYTKGLVTIEEIMAPWRSKQEIRDGSHKCMSCISQTEEISVVDESHHQKLEMIEKYLKEILVSLGKQPI